MDSQYSLSIQIKVTKWTIEVINMHYKHFKYIVYSDFASCEHYAWKVKFIEKKKILKNGDNKYINNK